MIAVLLHRFYIKNQYYCYPKFLVEYYTQCSLSIYFCYSPTIYFFIQTETKKIFFFRGQNYCFSYLILLNHLQKLAQIDFFSASSTFFYIFFFFFVYIFFILSQSIDWTDIFYNIYRNNNSTNIIELLQKQLIFYPDNEYIIIENLNLYFFSEPILINFYAKLIFLYLGF